MPIQASSVRDLRLSRQRAAYNRRIREQLQYLIRRCRQQLGHSEVAVATAAVAAVVKALDRATRAGVVKAATAARRKSRLMRQLNRRQRPPA